MYPRMLILLGLTLALGFLVAAGLDKTYDGTIVSVKEPVTVNDGEIVMTDGKNDRTFPIGKSVVITLNKKSAKLGDLRTGDTVTVTTDNEETVKTVAATREK